jgi:hypothetical protein
MPMHETQLTELHADGDLTTESCQLYSVSVIADGGGAATVTLYNGDNATIGVELWGGGTNAALQKQFHVFAGARFNQGIHAHFVNCAKVYFEYR